MRMAGRMIGWCAVNGSAGDGVVTCIVADRVVPTKSIPWEARVLKMRCLRQRNKTQGWLHGILFWLGASPNLVNVL